MSDRSADRVNVHVELPKRMMRLASDQLPAGVSLLLVAPEDVAPEFVRPPLQGKGIRCSVTGLSRSRFMALLDEAGPRITSKVLRSKGALKGITLVERQSLINYIHALPDREAGADDNEEE